MARIRSGTGLEVASTSEEPPLRHWREHLPPGVEFVPDDLTSSGTLLRAWSARWRSAPNALLWKDVRGPVPGPGVVGSGVSSGMSAAGVSAAGVLGVDGRPPGWWTAGRFDAATRTVAGRLQRAGLAPGDRVVWSTASSVPALVAHVGALRAGLVVIPVNTAYSEREVAHIVDDVRPAAAIVERTDQAEWIRRASTGAVLVLGSAIDLPDGEADTLDAAGPDDPALITYTSGTTGAPKGAVLRHRNLLAATESVTTAWRWGPDDRLVHCLPVFHAHGLGVGIYGTLLAGASALLLPGFDPAAVAEAARAGGSTLFFGVPTMYHRLVRTGQISALGHLRLCVSGSAPLAKDLHGEASAALGSPVLERYGMTETLMNVSNPYDGERRAGTVGFPLPGVEVMLSADDEILVRGPNVFDGYWERPAANADAFAAASDGGAPWFRTGDLGVDEDGYLKIRGRSKELIISGGFNVYPSEVEDVLLGHPGVAEVAVTGTPNDEWGEVVTAWIVPEGPPPTIDELMEFTSATLSAYKRPRLVRILEELPRNALGKVVRSQLET